MEDTTNPEEEATQDTTDAAAAVEPAPEINAPAAETQVHPAEFPEAVSRRSGARLPLERFSDVQVEISVEIGRVTMSLGEMMQLGPGAVVELDREVTEPVTITAQGVRIASGEVVVINDRFAVRITEVSSVDNDSAGAA